MAGGKAIGLEQGPDQVRRAADALLAARPGYGRLIEFYGDIFALQEEARPRVRLEPFQMTPEEAAARLRNRSPLIPVAEMRFDAEAGRTLFADLCRAAVARRTDLAGPAGSLLEHAAHSPPLFRDFLAGDGERLKKAASGFGAGEEALLFFIYHSLRPSLIRCGEALSGLLDDTLSRENSACPICGSPPALGWLDGSGERFLFCSFCWHPWQTRRVFCPLCGNEDPHRLSYLYAEEEKEYRVDLCETCRQYLKTVDSRQLGRPSYPALEHIGCLHLDIQASQAGFAPALPLAPLASLTSQRDR